MDLYEVRTQRPRAYIIKKLLEIEVSTERIIAPFGSNHVIALLSPCEALMVSMFRDLYIEKYKEPFYILSKK